MSYKDGGRFLSLTIWITCSEPNRKHTDGRNFNKYRAIILYGHNRTIRPTYLKTLIYKSHSNLSTKYVNNIKCPNLHAQLLFSFTRFDLSKGHHQDMFSVSSIWLPPPASRLPVSQNKIEHTKID